MEQQNYLSPLLQGKWSRSSCLVINPDSWAKSFKGKINVSLLQAHTCTNVAPEKHKIMSRNTDELHKDSNAGKLCVCVFYRLESRSSDFTSYCEDWLRRTEWNLQASPPKFLNFQKVLPAKGESFSKSQWWKNNEFVQSFLVPEENTAINSIIVSGLLIFRLRLTFQTNFLL